MEAVREKNDLSIVLCAGAGQGLRTIEDLLVRIIKDTGFYIFTTKENMSRIRGGCDSTAIRIANYPIAAALDRIDILVPFINEAFSHLKKRISRETLIISDLSEIPEGSDFFKPNFTEILKEFSDKIYVNVMILGFLAGLFQTDLQGLTKYIAEYFHAKGAEIIANNIRAAIKGYEKAKELFVAKKLKCVIPNKIKLPNLIALSGSEAITLGALAGGCNFISSYPMSPSTGVLTGLANASLKFDIVVEQAEDEIAAINMGLGAWYAGARALVTTSGGGFALMCEGISLAGMTEMPIVIHLGQRPGPATGLPTRTEQGDLNLALYAGHGEFPRIIFAPGSLAEAYELTGKAFHLADKFQIPVVILTDQYLMDSYALTPKITFKNPEDAKTFIVKTSKDYKRYKLTDNGISPRGIPDFGDGIVCVDSDEHTEEGYITEDFDTRIAMVNKRLKKFAAIEKESLSPEFIGEKNSKFFIVSWGSNYHNVIEAIERLNNKNIAFLHFSQVYPLAANIADHFKQAEKIIVIENNARHQFANLLRQDLNINAIEHISKYNGLPFTVEELVAQINDLLENP